MGLYLRGVGKGGGVIWISSGTYEMPKVVVIFRYGCSVDLVFSTESCIKKIFFLNV